MGRPKKFQREGVLDSVIPLFWRTGFAGANVQQIEEITGVNKSGLYAEFGSKEAMFVAALERYLETGPARRILDQQPLGWQNIEQFLLVAPQVSPAFGGCFSVNSTRDLATLPREATELIETFNVDRLASIKRNIEEETPPGDSDQLCDLVWTFFSGMCINANLGVDPVAHKNRVISFMRLLRSQTQS